MSSLDLVVGQCPHCGHRLEVQSKAGACEMRSYTTTAVPAEIAIDAAGVGGLCGSCGQRWELVCEDIRAFYRMQFVVPEEEQDHG